MDYRRDLLDAADRYCRKTGLARATLATKLVNDGKFFARIAAGGGCTMATYARVMALLADAPAMPDAATRDAPTVATDAHEPGGVP